jgi:hypothetical protein
VLGVDVALITEHTTGQRGCRLAGMYRRIVVVDSTNGHGLRLRTSAGEQSLIASCRRHGRAGGASMTVSALSGRASHGVAGIGDKGSVTLAFGRLLAGTASPHSTVPATSDELFGRRAVGPDTSIWSATIAADDVDTAVLTGGPLTSARAGRGETAT